jgi:hypothetical protein
MQAIRESNNPMRTMDAFWSGQLRSKEWLINCLAEHIDSPSSIEIHGGWVGVLASMLFQSSIPVTEITSLDIDPLCRHVALLMNKKEEIEGRFKAITGDMCKTSPTASIIINTSCEHITQDQYDLWLSNMPINSLLVLQSNNYDIPEHIRTATSVDNFAEQCKINVHWSGTLILPKYDRYMLIGTK